MAELITRAGKSAYRLRIESVKESKSRMISFNSDFDLDVVTAALRHKIEKDL